MSLESTNSTTTNYRYLIVKPENGGFGDLLRLFVTPNYAASKFLESSDEGLAAEEMMDGGGRGDDRRWVIFVSILVRKLIHLFGKPMEWSGFCFEFFLNLISDNGNLIGLLYNFLEGKVVMPRRGSETFISAIGHLDGRINLYNFEAKMEGSSDESPFVGRGLVLDGGNRALMDLCIMASKLAYENAIVVKNVVNQHWKMHFVDFYNCWNDYQKESSTQVFILCDKPKDANLILISFRGTEPFDADDWITDFDYSWYEMPKLGKVHMGFLEALGLGSRLDTSSFLNALRVEGPTRFTSSNGSVISSQNKSDSENGKQKTLIPEMVEMTAYFAVKSKLKSLLHEHKNANFLVTGHSLGGALAILFPTVLVIHNEQQLMQKLVGVYTYGQPRVGNRQLCQFMEARLNHTEPRYFRVVYCNDIVPRLPYDDKTFLYKHFGNASTITAFTSIKKLTRSQTEILMVSFTSFKIT